MTRILSGGGPSGISIMMRRAAVAKKGAVVEGAAYAAAAAFGTAVSDENEVDSPQEVAPGSDADRGTMAVYGTEKAAELLLTRAAKEYYTEHGGRPNRRPTSVSAGRCDGELPEMPESVEALCIAIDRFEFGPINQAMLGIAREGSYLEQVADTLFGYDDFDDVTSKTIGAALYAMQCPEVASKGRRSIIGPAIDHLSRAVSNANKGIQDLAKSGLYHFFNERGNARALRGGYAILDRDLRRTFGKDIPIQYK
jgi:hypothetical protein